VSETYSSGVWQVKAGEEDAFVEAWREFVGWSAGMDGSGTFRLVRDLGEPGRYLSFAPWESLDAARAWQQQPEFAELLGRVRAHCDDFKPSSYETVAVVD
jgi:heme-degrading monooxygenase HmoA